MREGLREWWKALHDSDNPLARYYALAEARRSAAVPLWRRYGLPAFVALLMLGLSILMLDQMQVDPEQVEAVAFTMVAIPVWFVWLLQGLHHAAQTAMGLLGRGGRRLHLVVDDMLALSALSDRQLVAGVLRVILRPLWPRAVVGALLVWVVALLVAIDFGENPAGLEGALVLLLSPLTVGGIAVVSMLALATLVLWWIVMGRGLGYTGSLASVHVALQALGLGPWVGMSLELLRRDGWGDTQTNFPIVVGGAFTTLALLALVLWLAGRYKAVRGLFAVGGPSLAPLLLAMLTATYGFGIYDHNQWLQELLLHWSMGIVWALSAVQPLSPGAVPVLDGLIPPVSRLGASWVSTEVLYVLLLTLQCVVVALSARYAVAAVAAHRREGS